MADGEGEKEKIARLRREYHGRPLIEAEAAVNPVDQFTRWFDEAVRAGCVEPNAMVLATATPDGRPSQRVLLLKEFDARGFAFYSNYDSRKGRELAENSQAALLFYWELLARQVRIEGVVSRIERQDSERYFRSRPRGAKLGAAASRQSEPLGSREQLDAAMRELDEKYGDDVPCPQHWGGYRLTPARFEFWQGRENRLHDRLLYERISGDSWKISRLYP